MTTRSSHHLKSKPHLLHLTVLASQGYAKHGNPSPRADHAKPEQKAKA